MSYRELLEMLRQDAEERRRYATEPPVSCEYDGEPLDETERGRHCRFCGRVYR